MHDPSVIDTDVRLHIYNEFLSSGVPPSVLESSKALGIPSDDVAAAYDRLAAARVIVLRPGTHGVLMAAPLSAVPTRFTVRLPDDRWYYANCIWDALGIMSMLGSDGVVEASCADCNEMLELRVSGGSLAASDAVVHFAIPASRWWEDIVFT